VLDSNVGVKDRVRHKAGYDHKARRN
jgi:hypothetical protein